MKASKISAIAISTVGAIVIGSCGAFAAIDDVIVWNSTRTQSQIESTLVNGYTVTTGAQMWWSFNNSTNLIFDNISGTTKGVIKGSPNSMVTATPNDTSNLAVSGFSSIDNWLATDVWTGTTDVKKNQTYEMWIRNPQLSSTSAVFWSITGSENGGGDADDKRLWINADGSLSMGDRGYYTGIKTETSSQLTWETDKWYQITVAIGYLGSNLQNVKVYRGAEGDTSVVKMLDYGSSIVSTAGENFWLSVGGHPAGFYEPFQGRGGYLGADTGVVPEPGSLLALVSGLVGLGGYVTRKRKS